MTGAARFLNNLYGNLVGNVTGNVTGDLTGTASNASQAAKLTTSRTISLTGAVTGSTTFDGSANKSITTSISLATGDTSGHVKIAGTNVKVKDINNAAYKDVTTKPTYNSSTLVTSDGVYKRITYRKFVLSVDGWGTETYDDNVFNSSGIYRQALNAGGEITANTEIVSVKLLGSQSGTKNNTIYYDQQFSRIFQVETGASVIEFRATIKPTVQMTVVVGYVIEDLNTVNTAGTPISTDRFVVEGVLVAQ